MKRFIFMAIVVFVATLKSRAQDAPPVTASGTYFENQASGSGDYKAWRNSNSTSETKASYREYNGTTYVLIKSATDVKLSLNCAAEVKKGSLEVLFEEDGLKPDLLFGFNNNGSANKIITLKAGIQYKIKFKGRNTRGSYKCSWSTL